MSSSDETQPRTPAVTPPHGTPPVEEQEPIGVEGPGCAFQGLILGLGLLLALVIVALAGAAGWTSGQREAQVHSEATRQAEIQSQLARIPGDVSMGNTVLLEARLGFLATQTPGVESLPALYETATAVYDNNIPTATPTVTKTPAAVPASPTPSEEVFIAPTIESENGYDLDVMLEEAQRALRTGQYEDAVDLLQAIEAIDSSFQRATVRGLILEALTTQALRLYRGGGNLAEAILLTDEAELYGLSADSELLYERYVAALYLDARNKIGINFPAAIQALQAVYDTAPNYRNGEVGRTLFNQLVAYGDAWVAEGNHCSAVAQYQRALTLFSDPAVSAKHSNAETACQQGATIPAGTPNPDIAPVGQPG